MLTCAHCTYSTKRKYNLHRHINSKHNGTIDTNIINNNTNNTTINTYQKVTDDYQKVTVDYQKVTDILPDENGKYSCKECYKIFTYKHNLIRHRNICKKITNPHECMCCHKVFQNKQNLCEHRKFHCKTTALVPYESKEVVPVVEKTNHTPLQIIQTQTNIGVVENQNLNLNQIQSQTNIANIENQDNSKNITINVFPTSLHSDYSINTDHFDIEELRKNIENQSIFEAVGTSLRMVLQNKNNLPVKKKSIKSKYSHVHLGKNKWEMRKDKEVYGLISFHISRCIQVYLDGANLKQLQKYYRQATEALEFVATDNMEDLEREYIQKAKRIMDVIVLSAYDRTDIEKSVLQNTNIETK
jgi:hypothetical protein